MSRRSLLGLVATGALVLAVAGACGPRQPVYVPVPELGPGEAVWSVFLIGDAGGPVTADAVLRAVESDLRARADRSFVVFLGDNLYPRGLPAPEAPDHSAQLARLERQVRVLTSTGVRGIFVPGNHDWDKGGPDGLNAVRRAGEAVGRMGAGFAEHLPADGCPGPEVRDVGAFRLVLLDTEWWLHEHARGGPACRASTDSAVVAQLGEALATAGEHHVIVAGHHPIRTGGKHGGHFPLVDHLFPLRGIKSWLWLPLPILGSIYPVARANGITRQDVSNGRNREMRSAIEDVMRPHRPLAYASGHEHTQQVIGGGSARWLLVSGAGYYGHTDYVSWLDSTRYATGASGYMRLDATATGRVRLSVLTVDAAARARETYSQWLE